MSFHRASAAEYGMTGLAWALLYFTLELYPFIVGSSMKHVLIVYSSRNGQTEKIARHLCNRLVEKGLGAQTLNLEAGRVSEPIDPQVDGIIVGAPVYAGKFPSAVIEWVRAHGKEIAAADSAFFSVSLNAADSRPASRLADDALLRDFFHRSRWLPAFTASVAGGLAYSRYGFFIKRILRWISASNHGPTDTAHDYELTDWNLTDRFVDAFVAGESGTAFDTANRLPGDRQFYSALPDYEQSWAGSIRVARPAAEVYAAFAQMRPCDMHLAQALAWVRTLGRKDPAALEPFPVAAKKFGMETVSENSPREITTGLIGRFWRLDFGIHFFKPAEFSAFNEPGYTKVLSRIRFREIPRTGETLVECEMRVHSTDAAARRRFRLYWTFMGLGIHLYMKSMLSTLKRVSERDVATGRIGPAGLRV